MDFAVKGGKGGEGRGGRCVYDTMGRKRKRCWEMKWIDGGEGMMYQSRDGMPALGR